MKKLLLTVILLLFLVGLVHAGLIVDQNQTTQNAVIGIGDIGGSDYIQAQGFTPTKTALSGISFYKPGSATGTPTGDFNVSIRADNAGKPAAAITASTQMTLAQFNALPTGFNYLSLPCTVSSGSLYWIVFKSTNANEAANNYYSIGRISSSTYSGGSLFYSTNGESTWTDWTWDSTFETWYPVSTSFTVNTTYTNSSGQVLFNSSTNWTPSSWAWNFGDGTANATTQNVTHSYSSWIGNSTAIYNTTLTATSTGGSDGIFAQNNITVYPILATWSANVTSGFLPLWVNFTPAITNGTANDNNFTWTTGATYDSTGTGGVHTSRYDTAGNYSVTLNVTNAGGGSYNWSTKSLYISVYSMVVSSFTADHTTGYKPLSVQFTDTSTGIPTSWLWQWGDGTANSTDQNPTHVFTTGGTYIVNLTTSNPYSSNLSSNTTITVIDTAYPAMPTASVTVAPVDTSPLIALKSAIGMDTGMKNESEAAAGLTNLSGIVEVLMLPLTNSPLGPLSWFLALSIPFVMLWIAQDNPIIPLIIGIIGAFGLIALGWVPAEYMPACVAFMGLSIAGIGYTLYRNR